MKITIVTDHRFFRSDNIVYDDYVFNYNFFETYLRVFDEVDVVARVKNVPQIDIRWQVASGPKLNFIDIPDIHGFKWLLFSKRFFRAKKEIIFSTDCLCFRLPSHASWEVFQMNDKNLPFIFESIGDPEDSMVSSNQSFVKQILYGALGNLLRSRKRKIVKNAKAGSYVSIAHLQKKFPVADNIYTESISSIRLNSNYIIGKKFYGDSKSVELIHVGSFIPLKNQKDLIKSVEKLITLGHNVYLHLVGEGRLKDSCITYAKELGISERIIFHGQVTGFQNIVKLLDQSQIFILPSSNEGMPRSLIEAMARGLVCFGSNAGGIAELLPKDFIFAAGNVDEMTTKISDYIKNMTEQTYQDASQRNIAVTKQFEEGKLEYKRNNVLQYFRKMIENERN